MLQLTAWMLEHTYAVTKGHEVPAKQAMESTTRSSVISSSLDAPNATLRMKAMPAQAPL